MTRRRRRILFWTGIAIVLAVISLRIYYVTCLREPKIIRKWVQLDHRHYDENNPYVLALVQRGSEFEGLIPRLQYYVVVGPSSSLFKSGKWYSCHLALYGVYQPSDIERLSVAWTNNGAFLSSSHGRSDFFPIKGVGSLLREE